MVMLVQDQLGAWSDARRVRAWVEGGWVTGVEWGGDKGERAE
jgi:hypothetical protein